MQTSTFSPASNPDPFTFDQAIAVDGVYGSGNDDPRFAVIQGVMFERDLQTGDFTGVVQSSGNSFRKLEGRLDLVIT